jgi:hypothetical protein
MKSRRIKPSKASEAQVEWIWLDGQTQAEKLPMNLNRNSKHINQLKALVWLLEGRFKVICVFAVFRAFGIGSLPSTVESFFANVKLLSYEISSPTSHHRLRLSMKTLSKTFS